MRDPRCVFGGLVARIDESSGHKLGFRELLKFGAMRVGSSISPFLVGSSSLIREIDGRYWPIICCLRKDAILLDWNDTALTVGIVRSYCV